MLMLWAYKYFLADFNQKFQDVALVWLETKYKNFLEYALKGYDIEIGGPIFGFSDNLNEKFGTKIFVAK
jgi:hypothetical protein